MIIISTSMGDIHLELDDVNAPKTTENFRHYIKSGFYQDTIFHRVINGFMIQGGGMNAEMTQKKTEAPIKNEAKKGNENKRGTIAMARTMDPHSATSQFFINLADNHFLDFVAENQQGYGYCAFGKVVEGMDVVDAIAKVQTSNQMGHGDVPVELVTINAVREV